MDPTTAGGVVTAIGSMAATTKTIIETIKAARAKAKNAEVETTLSNALEQIFSLQAGMIDLQAKVLSLQEENSQYREKIRQEEERAKDRRQYQRKQVGSSVVLIREEEPDVYYCPACFESKKQAIPLQRQRPPFNYFGSHECPSCKSNYEI
jgi:hypothetical protein